MTREKKTFTTIPEKKRNFYIEFIEKNFMDHSINVLRFKMINFPISTFSI